MAVRSRSKKMRKSANHADKFDKDLGDLMEATDASDHEVRKVLLRRLDELTEVHYTNSGDEIEELDASGLGDSTSEEDNSDDTTDTHKHLSSLSDDHLKVLSEVRRDKEMLKKKTVQPKTSKRKKNVLDDDEEYDEQDEEYEQEEVEVRADKGDKNNRHISKLLDSLVSPERRQPTTKSPKSTSSNKKVRVGSPVVTPSKAPTRHQTSRQQTPGSSFGSGKKFSGGRMRP